jgi:hypothetical protein
MTTEVIPYEQRIGALTVQDVQSQVNLIQHVMRQVMKKDEHYGVIPGTGTKPTLLKAGAEKLCLTFRLDPQYESTERYDGVHLTVKSKCTLFHIPSGQRFGSGEGSCSTRESKYAYRTGSRKCPNCGAEAIIKGKDFKGDGLPTGWICFGKKGGCGAKFLDGDKAIEGQTIGRIQNEDVADQYNTVLKMANKRSLVAAVLNATAASDIFTQDIEDMPQVSAQPVVDAQSIEAPKSDRDKELKELCAQAGTTPLSFLVRMKVKSAAELSDSDYQGILANVRSKIKAAQERTEVAGQA